jgi:Family of unknown function (DUF5681)
MTAKGKQRNPKYAVGYGRPPEHSRFKKGRSGNPAGRHGDAQNERGWRLLWQEANRKLMLREGDRIEKLTAIRAAIRSLFVSAAKGKTAALKMVLQAMNETAAADRDGAPRKIYRIIVDPNQPRDLSKLTESEVDELETLLSKAGKTET